MEEDYASMGSAESPIKLLLMFHCIDISNSSVFVDDVVIKCIVLTAVKFVICFVFMLSNIFKSIQPGY